MQKLDSNLLNDFLSSRIKVQKPVLFGRQTSRVDSWISSLEDSTCGLSKRSARRIRDVSNEFLNQSLRQDYLIESSQNPRLTGSESPATDIDLLHYPFVPRAIPAESGAVARDLLSR